MNTLTPTPTPGLVAREQVRTVGLAVRREVVLLAAAVGALVLFMGVVALSPALRVQVDGELPLNLNPEELGILAAMVAVFFPLAVWKGEAPWGDTPLWSFPVEHPRHVVLKIWAGWVWLMAVVLMGLLGICAAVLLAGGALGLETTRLLVVDPAALAASGGADGTTAVAWSSPGYQWFMPFFAATALYLLASALWVGTRHPIRWVVGLWIAVLAIGGFLELTEIQSAERFLEGALSTFDQLVTGGHETLRRSVWPTPGERLVVWDALPSPGRWAGISASWLALGVAAVVAAARRHRTR